MQGFMRQRGSSWELRVYVGRDAVTGRKRWVTKTVTGGKREAQRALAATVAEADRGVLQSTTATVGELLGEWFAHARPAFRRSASWRRGACSTATCSRSSARSGCRSSAPPTSTATTDVSATRAGGAAFRAETINAPMAYSTGPSPRA